MTENLRGIKTIIEEGRGAHGYELSMALAGDIQREFEETGNRVEINVEGFYEHEDVMKVCSKCDPDMGMHFHFIEIHSIVQFDKRIKKIGDEVSGVIKTLKENREMLLDSLTLELIKEKSGVIGNWKDIVEKLKDVDDELDAYRKISDYICSRDCFSIESDIASVVSDLKMRQNTRRKYTTENIFKMLTNNDEAKKVIEDVFMMYCNNAEYLIGTESFVSFGEPDGCSWSKARETITLIATSEATGKTYMNLDESGLFEFIKEAIKNGVSDFIEKYSIELENAADYKELINKKITEIEKSMESGSKVKFSEWHTNEELLEELKEKATEY